MQLQKMAIYLIGLLFGLLLTKPHGYSQGSSGSWLEVDIGIIGTASNDILETAMEEVSKNGYRGLFIKLDTPGGSLESTRSMVKAILGSNFPIVVWVGPGGARAGSAGAFITLAAHVAAMAPGTNIGAAHPIQASGQDIKQGDIKDKIENDTKAFMESIAKTRNRNVDMAISFVENSLSITAEEALEQKVIDIIASNPSELFEKLNGRSVELASGSSLTLNTEGDVRITYEKSVRQIFLEVLSNPNLFYLLFVAGLLGIGFELTNPGAMVPGVIGGICMVLALIATSVLPVSFGAMLLIVGSIACMVAEVFIPSFGILGIGGFVAFIIGSLLLVDPHNEQGLQISLFTILPGAAVVAGFGVLVFYLVVKVERSKPHTGAKAMVGKSCEALTDFIEGKGKVRFEGEIWMARARENQYIGKGEKLVVEEVNGLELLISSAKDEA